MRYNTTYWLSDYKKITGDECEVYIIHKDYCEDCNSKDCINDCKHDGERDKCYKCPNCGELLDDDGLLEESESILGLGCISCAI